MLYPLLEGDKYNQALLEGTDRLVAGAQRRGRPWSPSFRRLFLTVKALLPPPKKPRRTAAIISVVVVILLVLATVIPMATYFWYVGFGN